MIRKLGLAVGLFCIIAGCQGQRFIPENFTVPVIKLAPSAPPVDEESFLGSSCEADESSHVIERDQRYRSCVDGTWQQVDKATLESRVVTYTIPHVELVGVTPVDLGPGARYGQCVYTISYASDFMERQFVDQVLKVNFDWKVNITLKQDKPAATAVDCEVQTSEAARLVIEENWNIDAGSRKILGRKRTESPNGMADAQ